MARLGADEDELPAASGDTELVWAPATQWISRTLAVALLMVLPGVLGAMLDKRLGTNFLSLLGFLLGLIAGTTGLLVLAKRFTPPARGKPLVWEDDNPDQPSLLEPPTGEVPSEGGKSHGPPPKSLGR